MHLHLSTTYRLSRTGDTTVLARLIPGRTGGWVTICSLALVEPAEGVPHRVFEVSNKRVFIMPTNTGHADPFRGGGCRELRHIVARAVALGVIGAKLEVDETLTLTLGD